MSTVSVERDDRALRLAGEKYMLTIPERGAVGVIYVREDAESTARILNAFPDLLAACEAAYKAFFGTTLAPGTCEAIDMLYAAIAKAKGGGS